MQKNGNVYYGLFEHKENQIFQIGALDFKNISDAISTLSSQIYANTPIYFVGDGAILNKDLIESAIHNCIFTDKNNLNSYSLGIAGFISYISGQKPSVMPLYLRKSQAERALEEKKKKE